MLSEKMDGNLTSANDTEVKINTNKKDNKRTFFMIRKTIFNYSDFVFLILDKLNT
jgi:hypothetical protein